MQAAPYRLIPLRNRTGEIIDHAIVDEADYEWLSERRWCLSGSRYAASRDRGRRRERRPLVYMHRFILGLEQGDPREVDHINGATLDNRRGNLRIVTHAENAQNRARGANRNSRSGYRGVCWSTEMRRWEALGSLGGRTQHLGYFERKEDAAAVAASWRAQHMPFAES